MNSSDKLGAIVVVTIVSAILIAVLMAIFVFLDGSRRNTEERASMIEAGMSQCQRIQSDGRYSLYETHWALECPTPVLR